MQIRNFSLVASIFALLTTTTLIPANTLAQSTQQHPTAVSSGLITNGRDVATYWTPERMTQAIDVDAVNDEFVAPAAQEHATSSAGQGSAQSQEDFVRPTPPKPQLGSSNPVSALSDGSSTSSQPSRPVSLEASYAYPYPYSRYEYTGDYTAWPISTIGKVFYTNAITGQSFSCTGTAVNSGNQSVVVTAGHCIYGIGSRTFHINWAFVPAYKDGTAPYGIWTAREMMVLPEWTASPIFSFDVGIAVVNTNSQGQTLVDTVGGQGLIWNYARQQYFHTFGYPYAAPFTGQRLIACEGPHGADELSIAVDPVPMGMGCDMTAGVSGSGWMVRWNPNTGGYIGGVTSHRPATQPQAFYGTYFGSRFADLYHLAESK